MNVYEHPDWLALEAGIIEDPDNDLRRLVVADWLEEQGEADRGEFIRLQVEITGLRVGCQCGSCVALRGGGQHHNSSCAVDNYRVELSDGTSQAAFLRLREAELFHRYRSVWWSDLYTGVRRNPSLAEDAKPLFVRVERGWPATLVGRATDILRGRRCGVGCWPSSVSNRCVVCDDFVRDRPYGYEIIREQPVTKIVLTDDGYYPYCLNVPSHDGDGSHREVEWFLTSDLWHLGDELSGTFETEQDALDALSDAIIADARSV